ncbi:MAG: hypothetical protein JWO47_358 [Candidatus Saccharibacteria bacterium]|nr:hypothetical protein [Candidatus Saccharibacteria bacterium]
MHKLSNAIQYNRSTQVGAIHDDPFTFLLHDQFFDDFKIVTGERQEWLYELPLKGSISDLGMETNAIEGVSRLVKLKKFVELTKSEPKRKYLLYSPVDPPYKVNPLALLMNSPTIAHAYENKRYFRDEFADLIRMPEYEIKYISELDKAASYRELREELGTSMVLQDEESFGSRGTYIVHNYDEFVDAVKLLKKFSQGRSVVVSRYVAGQTSSIQVCITKYGIFSGGIQRQLVTSKYLCNPKLEGTTKWCGGEVGVEYPDIVQHQSREIASVVGSELASHGYKGIFGIDLIVTPENEVYAIEINARHTGYSHLISDMQLNEGKIPFLLLHALELGNFDYEVTDTDKLPSAGRYKKPVSFMIFNNPLEVDFELKETIHPGIYLYKDGKLEFVKPAYSVSDLKGEDMVLVLCRYKKGDLIGTGRRIIKVTKFGKIMAKDDDLSIKTQLLVSDIKKSFNLPK